MSFRYGYCTVYHFVVALMYGGIGVILSKLRGAEDELNTLAAASATGLLYKSTGIYCNSFHYLIFFRVVICNCTHIFYS